MNLLLKYFSYIIILFSVFTAYSNNNESKDSCSPLFFQFSNNTLSQGLSGDFLPAKEATKEADNRVVVRRQPEQQQQQGRPPWVQSETEKQLDKLAGQLNDIEDELTNALVEREELKIEKDRARREDGFTSTELRRRIVNVNHEISVLRERRRNFENKKRELDKLEGQLNDIEDELTNALVEREELKIEKDRARREDGFTSTELRRRIMNVDHEISVLRERKNNFFENEIKQILHATFSLEEVENTPESEVVRRQPEQQQQQGATRTRPEFIERKAKFLNRIGTLETLIERAETPKLKTKYRNQLDGMVFHLNFSIKFGNISPDSIPEKYLNYKNYTLQTRLAYAESDLQEQSDLLKDLEIDLERETDILITSPKNANMQKIESLKASIKQAAKQIAKIEKEIKKVRKKMDKEARMAE